MAAGLTIKHKRKAGAFSNGELAAGEIGVDTTNEVVYFSADGTTVVRLPVQDIGTSSNVLFGSVEAANGVLIDPTNAVTAAQALEVAYGNLRFDTVANAATPTVALAGAGAGNVDNGVHHWVVTFVSAAGETFPASASAALRVTDKTADGKVTVTIPTSANSTVTLRKIYRSKAGGGPFYLVATVSDNTTTTYTDNTADSSLSTLGPSVNESGARIYQNATAIASYNSAGFTAAVRDKAGQFFNVKAYGAQADTQIVATGAMSAAAATLTVGSASFASSHVGRVISVVGAGAAGAPLVTTISGFTSTTQVTLADAASTTVSGAEVMWGSDDTAGVQAAIDAAYSAGGGRVYLPHGKYTISQIALKSQVWVCGSGWGTQLNHRGGASGHMIVASDVNIFQAGLSDLNLHGRKTHQSAALHGVYLNHTGTSSDKVHTFYNLYVQHFKGSGLYMGPVSRACRFAFVYLLSNDGVGWHFEAGASDNTIFGCDVGLSGLQGIYVASSNNRFTNTKSFYSGQVTSASGYGLHVVAGNNEFTGCEMQDNLSHGWYLASGADKTAISNGTCDSNLGDCFRLDGCLDSVVRGQVLDSARGDQTAIVNLTGGAARNLVEVTFTTAAVAAGTVYVQGTVSGNDVRVGPQGGFQTLSYPTLTWTVVAATDVMTTSAAHGLAVNDPVYLSNSGGALPAATPALSSTTVYYVKTVPSTTTLTIAPTAGGTTIDFTGTGTGTQSILFVKPNPYLGSYLTLTLTQDTTIPNPTQQHQNQRLQFQFTQDATGGRQITWGDKFLIRKWTPNTGASKANTIDFVYNGTNWIQTGGTNEGFGDPGTLDRTTGSVAFNTSSSENTLYTVTVPADLMGATGGLKVRLFGDMLCNSGTTNTCTFRIKFGGTTLWADASAAFSAASATRIPWVLDFLIGNAGATNSQVMGGILMVGAQGAAATTGEGDAATVAKVNTPVYGTSSIDTTAATTMLVTAQMSTNNAAVEITRKWAVTEFLA